MTMTNAERSERAVNEVVKERLDELEKAGATFKKLAKELCTIAFSDIKNYISIAEGGEVQAIPLDQIKGCKSKAIKKIKEKTNIVDKGDITFKTSQVEYELYDKMAAIKELLSLRGDYPAEKIEHSGPDGGPMEFSRLDRANRLAAIAQIALKRKKEIAHG